MPLCDRPHYLRRVLDGLIQVAGIEEVRRVALSLASMYVVLLPDADRLLARLCTISHNFVAGLLTVKDSFSHSTAYSALLFTTWPRPYQ